MKNFCSGKALLFAALLLSAFLTGGCDDAKTTTPEPKAKPTVGILLYREDDFYISMVRLAMLEALDGKAEALVFYAQGNQLTQNDLLDKLIAQNVDGLAINLVDTQAASSVLDLLKKADIPVVFFNREPDLNIIRLYNKAAFVGTNTAEAGILQGEIITRLWKDNPEFDRNKDGKFQYVLFQGNADNPEAIARTEYSIRQALENGVPMRQVGQNYVSNWDKSLAADAMRVAMLMHMNEIELVVANNDSMALGAISALQESGFNLPGGDLAKFIPVVGVDAIPPAIEAINEGIMSATVKQDSTAMGRAISSLLMNIINGRDFLEGTSYQWDESGVAIRIPYSQVSGDD